METADEKAREVIRAVRTGNFWPPEPMPPIYAEDFAAICLDNVFEKPAAMLPGGQPHASPSGTKRKPGFREDGPFVAEGAPF